MSGWQSGIGICLLIHRWLVVWVQFPLETTLFLLKPLKPLDVNFVQKCQKRPIFDTNEKLDYFSKIDFVDLYFTRLAFFVVLSLVKGQLTSLA